MKSVVATPKWTRTAYTALAILLGGSLLASSGCSALVNRDGGSETGTSGYSTGTPGAPTDAKSQSGAAVAPDQAALAPVSPEVASSETRSTAGSAVAEKQLMIRTANMRIQVKNVEDSLDRLRALTSEFGGLVEALQISSQQDVPIYRPANASGTYDATPLAAYATVRVPQDQFDAFLKRVAALGKVLVQSESGTDVTQQHIDLSARLTTLKAEEARLREFLAAATTVQDMLAVESELSRVRGEIESLQGQLDYLDKQIAMSALTVELVRPAPVVSPGGTDWGFADALRNGIRGAATVLASTITILISLLPLIALIGIVSLVVIAIVRARRRALARRSGGFADEDVDVTASSEAETEGEPPDSESER